MTNNDVDTNNNDQSDSFTPLEIDASTTVATEEEIAETIEDSASDTIATAADDLGSGGTMNADGQLILDQFAADAYLRYAMTVITSRALPSVRDGHKPVQNRILYAMGNLGLKSDAKKVKSARVVGEVLGKLHPHGDTSIYDAAVRMSQEFTLRYPLIDGQGNFGSRDGDGPAAMRYTEMRLTAIAELMLSEIDKNTVDFRPNFDDTTQEPTHLPARLPMLLLNGVSGIAVGMATEIPSHNLREVVEATLLMIKNPQATIDDILTVIPGPDFPNGGQIISSPKKLRDTYETGRGSIRVRARWRKEELARGQWRIVVYEHAAGSNTVKVLQEIEACSNPKPLKGKKDLSQNQKNTKALILSLLDFAKDESTKDDVVRLVLEPKTSKVNPEELLAALFQHTSLECSYPVNMTMIGMDGKPARKGLTTILREWIDFRHEVVTRRTQHRLKQVQDRIHILQGRYAAFVHINEVIGIIRESEDPKAALMQKLSLSEIQAEDILEIRLRQLARLEGIKIEEERNALGKEETHLQGLLADPSKLTQQVTKELQEDSKKHGDERRTVIEAVEDVVTTRAVPDEEITVFVSRQGWVRAKLGHGVDKATMPYKQGDEEGWVLETRTVNPLLILDTNGRSYSIDASTLPTGRGDGTPLSAIVQMPDGGKLAHAISDVATATYLFANSNSYGFVAKVSDLMSRGKAGKQFQRVEPGEKLLQPLKVTDMNHWLAACSKSATEARMVIFQLSEMKVLPGGKGVMIMAINDGEELSNLHIVRTNPPTSIITKLSNGRTVEFTKDVFARFLTKRARKGCQVAKGIHVVGLA